MALDSLDTIAIGQERGAGAEVSKSRRTYPSDVTTFFVVVEAVAQRDGGDENAFGRCSKAGVPDSNCRPAQWSQRRTH